MSNPATVTVTVIQHLGEDNEVDRAEAVFEGANRRADAEQWARTALTNHREITAFPDEMRAHLQEESLRLPRSMTADATLYHPDDPLHWDDHGY